MPNVRLLLVVAVALHGCARAAVDDTAQGAALGADWAQGITSRCAPSYSASWQPVTGRDRRGKGALPKPRRGAPFSDPIAKTCVVRVTDREADPVAMFARADYARRQAFNVDDSKLVLAASDGSWHWYDGRSSRYGGKLEGLGGDAEPQWNPTDPDLLYYLPAFGIGMQIREYDLRTGKTRVVADLAKRIGAVWPTARSAWTKGEGSPSADARYWAFMVDDGDWKGLGLLTYDLVEDRVLATYDLAKHRKDRPDHVSMSPTGQYVVVSWDDGPWVFTRDFAKGSRLHPKGEHSDLALDANGDDVYVSIDYGDGNVFMRNLRTGVRTNLFATYLDHSACAMHFSGKAFRRPGWALVSTYAPSGPLQWFHGKVFAVELAEKPRVVHLAHHHSIYNEYFTEPHATVNRDFTRVVFNSNWDVNSKTDVDAYLVELPRAVIPGARR
jgi:WD40 repeat protein